MLKRKFHYIIFLLFTTLFVACDAWIYEYPEAKPGNNEPLVYISISKVAHAFGEESVNSDAVDFEDRMHDLAMFVFDSNTNDLVVTYFDENIPFDNKITQFTVALIPGERDFYFVANMNMAELKAITTRTALETYLLEKRNLDADLYMGATTNKGFPMSRIYLNQTIAKGGNVLMPEPFKPVVDEVPEEKVKLERVVAKLEVKFAGTAAIGVKKIYYKNANRKYSLVVDNALPTLYYTAVDTMKKTGDSYLYYMPETWTEDATWTTPYQPINYFVIESLEGTFYEIPIISHDNTLNSNDYLPFAKGQESEQPDYTIYRNRHYLYTINNLQQLEINYQIDPWEKVSFTTFMGYGFNIKIDDKGEVTIENTVEACDPHEIELKTLGSFKFSDSTTSKVFDDADPEASIAYTLSPMPGNGAGDYLEVYYNGVLVKTFSK